MTSAESRRCSCWTDACGSDGWSAEVLPRAFRATGTFLAARGFGPFAYAMSGAARERVRRLAASLATDRPATLPELIGRAVRME